MSGTKDGGARANATIVAKLGEEGARKFRQEIGRKGGIVKGANKGFASMTPERRREIGRKGGSISRGGAK